LRCTGAGRWAGFVRELSVVAGLVTGRAVLVVVAGLAAGRAALVVDGFAAAGRAALVVDGCVVAGRASGVVCELTASDALWVRTAVEARVVDAVRR